MNSVSIDIGTYSIKAVASKKKKDSVDIVKVIEVPNYLGVSIPTDDASKEKIAQQLDSIFTDNSLTKDDIRLALPESAVSTKVIQVPYLTDAELSSAIGWQAEQFIPIPKEELTLEYQVLFRPEKNDRETPMRVLLVGAKKNVVEHYVSIFSLLSIEPSFLETQTISLMRSIHPTIQDPTTLVANVGFSSLDISIARGGELTFVFSHPQGGMLLTRAVENTLSLPVQQAEEYKRTYGLDPQYFEGRVQVALQPVVKSMIDQIQKAIHFYSTQYPQEAVQRVVLSGGTANLPGLVSYAAANLGIEVLLAAPFSGMTGAIPEVNQAAYAVCVGLNTRDE